MIKALNKLEGSYGFHLYCRFLDNLALVRALERKPLVKWSMLTRSEGEKVRFEAIFRFEGAEISKQCLQNTD